MKSQFSYKTYFSFCFTSGLPMQLLSMEETYVAATRLREIGICSPISSDKDILHGDIPSIPQFTEFMYMYVVVYIKCTKVYTYLKALFAFCKITDCFTFYLIQMHI